MIITATAESFQKGGFAMARTIRIRVTTNVRRVSNSTYLVKTTASNGSKTKTTTKTVRAR